MSKVNVTSDLLFETLAKRLQGQSDLQARITAHVREKTGQNTLFAYQQNGATEEEKIALWKECLAAIVNGALDSLGGVQANGQAKTAEKSPPTPKVTPTAKLEGKAERLQASSKAETSEIEQLRDLLAKIMGQKTAQIDEDKVKDIVLASWLGAKPELESIIATRLSDFAATFTLMLDPLVAERINRVLSRQNILTLEELREDSSSRCHPYSLIKSNTASCQTLSTSGCLPGAS